MTLEPVLSKSFPIPAEDVFDISDAFLEAAHALFLQRKNNVLTEIEQQDLINAEITLRTEADRYRAQGITLLEESSAQQIESINTQISYAKATIEKVGNIKHAIDIAAALVTLSAALASGQPSQIQHAGQSLQNLVNL